MKIQRKFQVLWRKFDTASLKFVRKNILRLLWEFNAWTAQNEILNVRGIHKKKYENFVEEIEFTTKNISVFVPNVFDDRSLFWVNFIKHPGSKIDPLTFSPQFLKSRKLNKHYNSFTVLFGGPLNFVFKNTNVK